jgi:hypothetical protein
MLCTINLFFFAVAITDPCFSFSEVGISECCLDSCYSTGMAVESWFMFYIGKTYILFFPEFACMFCMYLAHHFLIFQIKKVYTQGDYK